MLETAFAMHELTVWRPIGWEPDNGVVSIISEADQKEFRVAKDFFRKEPLKRINLFNAALHYTISKTKPSIRQFCDYYNISQGMFCRFTDHNQYYIKKYRTKTFDLYQICPELYLATRETKKDRKKMTNHKGARSFDEVEAELNNIFRILTDIQITEYTRECYCELDKKRDITIIL